MALRLKDVKGLPGIDLKGFQKRGRFTVAPKSKRTLGGIVFDSKHEMQRFATLQLGERAKMLTDLERQPAFPVTINGEHYCTYTADFRYVELLPDGSRGATVVEECESEGTAKEKDRKLRRKAAELFYGFTVRKIMPR